MNSCYPRMRTRHPAGFALFSARHANSRVPRRMMFSMKPLPLSPPSLEEETQLFNERVASLSRFFTLPRFSGIKRPYRPADIASKQGSLPIQPPLSASLADKLFALLARAEGEKQPLHTMGAIDPVQMTQMAKHQEVLYVSGWASSSVLTTANNEVGPDLAYVGLIIPFMICLTSPNQRLSLYNGSESSPPFVPRPTVT